MREEGGVGPVSFAFKAALRVIAYEVFVSGKRNAWCGAGDPVLTVSNCFGARGNLHLEWRIVFLYWWAFRVLFELLEQDRSGV